MNFGTQHPSGPRLPPPGALLLVLILGCPDKAGLHAFTSSSAAKLLFDTPPSATLTLSGSLDLARVIDTVAARLNVRVNYDPAVVTGKVTVRGEAGSAAQLWELMHALLASRGLTTVRAGDDAGFTVVRLAQAAQQARARHDSPNLQPALSITSPPATL